MLLNVIWWHRSGTTLAQVLTWCLIAPSHYLNQCWLTFKPAPWHAPESNFARICKLNSSITWLEQKHVEICKHPLAHHTGATLNTVSWNSESKWPNNLESQGQWSQFSIPVGKIPRCIFGENLVLLTLIHYKLSPGQVKFPTIPSENGQNYLQGQGQGPPLSICIPGYIFSANLVIPAQICDDLSHGQVKFPRILSQNGQNNVEGQGPWPPFHYQLRRSHDACLVIPAQYVMSYHADKVNLMDETDRLTNGQTQATTIPLRPRGIYHFRNYLNICPGPMS